LYFGEIGCLVKEVIVPVKPAPKVRFYLWIKGRQDSIDMSAPYNPTKKIWLPWKSFYKWYFGKNGKPWYIFRTSKAETMIRRDEISHWMIFKPNEEEK